MKRITLLLLAFAAIASAAHSTVTPQPFGELEDGRNVTLYVLEGKGGLRAEIMDFGATLVRLYAPDRDGKMADVNLGFERAADYPTKSPYFGATVGRVAGRIAKGSFELEGKTYTFALNNTPNGIPCTIHGGKVNFSKLFWRGEPTTREGMPAVRFSYTSPDGDEGFPGELQVQVTYSLTAENGLRIDYHAVTNKPTPVNLTNHSYFNLKGEGNGNALDHVVTIRASRYTKLDLGLIPTGELPPVAGTPLDFTEPRRVGDRIEADHEQLKFANGYDHNYVLDRKGDGLELAATVYEPTSGRVMEVWTTQPAVQFYSGNFLKGNLTGKSGQPYVQRGGLAFETQHFPDSIHRPEFPNTILRPGEEFRSTTEFRFSARK